MNVSMTDYEKRDKEIKEISNGLKKLLDGLEDDKANSVDQEETDAFMVLDLILAGDREKLSSLPISKIVSFVHALRNTDDPHHQYIGDGAIDEEELLSALTFLCKETSQRAHAALDESHKNINEALNKINSKE